MKRSRRDELGWFIAQLLLTLTVLQTALLVTAAILLWQDPSAADLNLEWNE